MQEDPVRYYQDLTESYRQMFDGELLELAAKPDDLTDVAQQVLQDEIRKRGLDERRSSTSGEVSGSLPSAVPRKNFDFVSGSLSRLEDVGSDVTAWDRADEPATEYTWKTVLCECTELIEAEQLHELLKRAGIESWIEGLGARGTGTGGPRVLVAADQLEHARVIAEQPIPQDVIDESQIEVPEFASPVCPKCGTPDPVLQNADPVNAWLCEACGAEWTDASDEDNGRV